MKAIRRALPALGRWIGWWVATGLLVFTPAVVAAKAREARVWDRPAIEVCASVAVLGILLGTILWRRRRDKDGAVAAIILTTGFWVAVWVALWPSMRN